MIVLFLRIAIAGALILCVVGAVLTARQYSRAVRWQHEYRFHALRDRLCALVVDGDLDGNGPTFRLLCLTLNLAIRNAGRWRMKHMARLGRFATSEAFDDVADFFGDIERQPAVVQLVAKETFLALQEMLTRNLWVDVGVRVHRWRQQRRQQKSQRAGRLSDRIKYAFAKWAPHYVAIVGTVTAIESVLIPRIQMLLPAQTTSQDHLQPVA